MNRQESEARSGYVNVRIKAETVMGDLPKWLDTRAICNAAIGEYERQRMEATGGLPLPETREAYS